MLQREKNRNITTITLAADPGKNLILHAFVSSPRYKFVPSARIRHSTMLRRRAHGSTINILLINTTPNTIPTAPIPRIPAIVPLRRHREIAVAAIVSSGDSKVEGAVLAVGRFSKEVATVDAQAPVVVVEGRLPRAAAAFGVDAGEDGCVAVLTLGWRLGGDACGWDRGSRDADGDGCQGGEVC